MNKITKEDFKKKYSITIRVDKFEYDFVKMVEKETNVKMSNLLRQLIDSMMNGYAQAQYKQGVKNISENI